MIKCYENSSVIIFIRKPPEDIKILKNKNVNTSEKKINLEIDYQKVAGYFKSRVT